jgi:peptidoglycan hydrolase-like amidase
MRRALSLLFFPLIVAAPAAAQEPDPQTPPPDASAQAQHERLEEEFIRSRMENGESHASGARPELGPIIVGNPTRAVVALRVGLNATTFTATGAVAAEFATLHHVFVELTNTDGDVNVIDRETGKQMTVMSAGSLLRVEHDGQGFLVTQDGVLLGSVGGPVFLRPTSRANLFRVESIRRVFSGTKVPLYRGALEIGRGPTTAALPPPARVNLINIVAVEDYVPGVVANESIASFAIEALKAQAVAARGYAIANIGNYAARGYPFDIVDSSASQVYRGVISEHVNAVRAASETLGLVASSNGRIISAMYSSSFGGHSEDNEWISFVLSRTMGGAPLSHLRGVYDGAEPAPDFSSVSGVDTFWRTNPMPQIYDDCGWTGNGFSRWQFTLPVATIKNRLTASNSTLITGFRTGTITDVAITQRTAASQRAAVIRITLANPDGVVELRGWESLRSVIGRTAATAPRACGTALIAANFTLNNPSSLGVTKNADGTVNEVTVYGGGWGHNLGMSQYGAHGRGKHGQKFIDILKAYYTGVDIGSHPIDIGRDPGSGPPTLRQEFVAPNAQGVLVIRPSDLKGLRVHINGLYDLSFDAATLAADVLPIDVSPYLVPGLNVIQYNPVGRAGRATVSVIVQ